jgi:hypothetical protein
MLGFGRKNHLAQLEERTGSLQPTEYNLVPLASFAVKSFPPLRLKGSPDSLHLPQVHKLEFGGGGINRAGGI